MSFTHKKYPRGSEKRWIYCVYLTTLETAVRARELWGIKLKDLPKSGTKLKILRQSLGGGEFVLTKGKDSRFVPFSLGLQKELASILSHETHDQSEERTLFVTVFGASVDHDNGP